MKKTSNYLKVVRNQYEDYPYPTRNPEDEKHRLLRFNLCELSAINHYCHQGARSFDGYQVLVAGGGTGDGTIFMAHQLKPLGGHVVHLDISTASIKVAQERAQIRGLDNITWIHESLLELPNLNLGPFDYINCTGVLHHLVDPDAGFKALTSALKPDGAVGIMVYAEYGRAGVYHMQSMLQLINQNERSMDSCIKNAKSVLGSMPPSNWFRHNEELLDDVRLGDTGIYDMLLHSHDRAYTVPQCYEFVANVGLHFGGFSSPLDRALMTPELQIDNPVLLEKLSALSQPEQEAAMELFSGAIVRHCYYGTAKADQKADLENLENVPYLFSLSDDFGQNFAQGMRDNGTEPMTWQHQGYVITVQPQTHSADLLEAVDGTRTLAQVFDVVREKVGNPAPTDTELLADFKPVFEAFERMDFMLLRHHTVAPFPPVQDTQPSNSSIIR
jgi:2-polyprenyl-3-methyl-5-hydroxy-6-metoxy-1,4-benzoquinol methylase